MPVTTTGSAGSGREGHPIQEGRVVQHEAGPAHDAREGVVTHGDGQIRLAVEQPVEAGQERAAPRQDDALVHDVRRQLGRRLLEAGPHRLDDRGDGLPKRLAHLGPRDA